MKTTQMIAAIALFMIAAGANADSEWLCTSKETAVVDEHHEGELVRGHTSDSGKSSYNFLVREGHVEIVGASAEPIPCEEHEHALICQHPAPKIGDRFMLRFASRSFVAWGLGVAVADGGSFRMSWSVSAGFCERL